MNNEVYDDFIVKCLWMRFEDEDSDHPGYSFELKVEYYDLPKSITQKHLNGNQIDYYVACSVFDFEQRCYKLVSATVEKKIHLE